MKELFKVLQEAVLFRFRNKITHLILHVTTRCNFRCSHCFVDPTPTAPELTLTEIDRIAAEFNDLIWLDIGGGEPFLRPDLPEILAKFQAWEYSVPTNGWFTERIFQTLKEIEARIDLTRLILTMSLDGFPATHDAIRNQPGSYARVKETYFLLRRHFPRLRVKFNTVLHNYNLAEIIPFMRQVQEELQPAFHSVLFLRGTPQDEGYRLPSPQEIRALEEQLLEIQNRYHYRQKGLLSETQKKYQAVKRHLCRRILEEEQMVIPCLAGQAHAVIYADGGVAPCELLPVVDSLRATPLQEILAGPAWRRAVAAIKAKKCYCTHDCNMIENILYNFNLYPQFVFGSRS